MGESPDADADADAAGAAVEASEGIAWGTGEELLLASAVERFGCSNWDRVAAELRSRPSLLTLPPAHFTPEACKLKFYALENKLSSNTSMEKKHEESLPLIEELRQRRIEYLKHEICVREISINLRQEKLKRLKAERDKELLVKNTAAFVSVIPSPASSAELPHIIIDTTLPLDHVNLDKVVQNSDPHNACNDNDMVKKHMDGEVSHLPTSCSLPGIGHTSFSVARTAVVDVEALRCLELDENKGLDPDPASAARTKEKHSRMVNENFSKIEQDVFEKEFVYQENSVLEVVDKPDLGQHCPSNVAVVKLQKLTEATKNVESSDVERGEILPAITSVHDACNALHAEKKENLLIDKHAPTEVLDNTQVQERGGKSLSIEPKSIQFGQSRCEVLDEENSEQSVLEADTKHANSVQLVSEKNSSAMKPVPRVGSEMNDSFSKKPQEAASTCVDLSFLSTPHSKLVSMPKMDHMPVLDNENVRTEKPLLQATEQQLTAEISPELIVSSEGVGDLSFATTNPLVLNPLHKSLSDRHLLEKGPRAVLIDPPESLPEESVLQKQQSLILNAKIHISETPESKVGSAHEVENTSPTDLGTDMISRNEKPSLSPDNRENVEHQRDPRVTPGHDVLEQLDISTSAVLRNSVKQKSELGRDNACDSAKSQERTAQSIEASKLGKPMEKLREVNSAFQVATTPFNQDNVSKHIPVEATANEEVFQTEMFKIVPPVQHMESQRAEKKSHKYRNREGSDESEQAFANNLGEGMDGAQLRSKMDMGRTEQEKNAEIGRQDDDTTISPASLDQSLAALGSKASSMSHEGSGSAQEHSKDADGQPATRDYGDSQAEKSEVGSPADGVDDTSLTSKRSKREPRVPGKLQPLLECLRLICAHKFAPLFKQKQESQDNRQYDLLIRRHMDLGMIRARLEEGAYSGSLEFFRDLLLIFQNALVYFSKDSQEYGAAKVLRKYAIDEMDKIFKTEASLKQDRPATRKRDSRKSSELAKQARTAGTAFTESRKRDKPRLAAAAEFAYSEPVLESEGKSKSVSLSMGGPSSRNDDADIFLSGDQEVDTHLGETPIKSSKLTSQNVKREESQTLQELRYHLKGPIKEEPRDIEKDLSKRPTKGLEYTASSGDTLEIERKAVKLRSNLKGARTKDFTSKTSKLSMIQQAIKTEDVAFQHPLRASRSIKQGNLRPKEENPIKKRVRK